MEAIERLSQSIRFKTVSGNWQEFSNFHAFLEKSFPLVYQRMKVQKINDYSLVYNWTGKRDGAVLLLAHMDVVPAEEREWVVPPFSGEIRDGYIWGRGTLDDKCCVMAILEAAEKLLSEGFTPNKSIYIAFGFDEETKGYLGARKTAEHFKSRDIKFDAILDEGAAIIEGFMPQIKVPLALVGVAEKGLASFDLIARGDGGHSSAPKRNSPVERMAKAIERVSSYKSKAVLTQAVEMFFKTISKYMSFPSSIFLKNPRLFLPFIERSIARNPSANAMLRTTMCTTIVKAGMADNVIPDLATATVNVRIIPGETAQQVFDRLKNLLSDLDIEVMKNEKWEVSDPVTCSNFEGTFFESLSKTINDIFPQAVVTPFLTIGGTDSRHYKDLSSKIYRFAPILMSSEEMKLVHGKNERISIENYKKMIDFYYQLIKRE